MSILFTGEKPKLKYHELKSGMIVNISYFLLNSLLATGVISKYEMSSFIKACNAG